MENERRAQLDQGNKEEERKQEEERKRQLLVQIMTPEARERLARVHLVKPEKAKSTEDYLLSIARSGRLKERISEDMLIQLLEQVSKQEQKSSKIIVQRRGDDDTVDLSQFDL